MAQLRTFGYWMPGGKTGEVQAETPIKAAEQVLQSKVQWCRGESLSQPWVYVSDPSGSECQLWERKQPGT